MLNSMNKCIFIRLFAICFSGITTFVYASYFPYEEMNPFAIFAIQIVIFLPIAIGAFKADVLLRLSFYSFFGSVIGFISSCILNDVGIWPIAAVFWAVLSLSSIVLLNIVGQRIKDHRRV